jgi:tetratricopeptide (TPR) repeat protein
MLGRIAECMLAFLDWCWPLPLGAFAVALVFFASAGIWLAFRQMEPALQSPPPVYPHPAVSSPAPQEELTTPSQSSPVTTNPFPARNGRPYGSLPMDISPPGALSRPETANRIPAHELRRATEKSHAQEPVTTTKAAASHAQGGPQIVRAKPSPLPAVRQLSPAQQAGLRDKLTLGRFLMDRKDYSAAIAQFQAALAIDPSNREAQAAIQQAREADKSPEPSPQP